MKPTAISVVLIVNILICNLFELSESLDGLYLATRNEIFFKPEDASFARSAYKAETYSRIVGLAYNLGNTNNRFLFWSDVSISGRGIYQATIGFNGILSDNKTLVNTDVQEVNCITVDWYHQNLYWTDALKKTIEVINFLTGYRRVIISDSLSSPRGIFADPVNGHLFWNDQGSRNIERSRLDGSERKQIVGNENYPNQMVVYESKLYWVNSDTKTLERSELDGSQSRVITSTPNKYAVIFGLAIFDGIAYITTWTGEVVVVPLANAENTIVTRPTGDITLLFSTAYFSDTATLQPLTPNNPCQTAGCSHLCLGVDNSTVRCSCPSFGGLVLKKGSKTCQAVSGNILLYALGGSGFVGYTPVGIETVERYFIARSTRPVSVAYDPVQQIVYWSDVSERTVHSARLDGSAHSLLLTDKNGLGVIDGMVFDSLHNKLYYSHFGEIYVDGTAFSWHKIEAVDLNQPSVIRTIVDGDQKPRALALDLDEGYLYYTDWSDRSRIVRINLDGSDPVELRAGLDNPNGLALVGNGSSKILYYIDSHYKTRANANYPGDAQNGTLNSLSTNSPGNGFMQLGYSKLRNPFGLAWRQDANSLYVSDWDRRSVVSYSITDGTEQVILEDVESPMMVVYTPYSMTSPAPQACSSGNGGCSDSCFTDPQAGAVCNCNSYSTNTLRSLITPKTCSAPDGFSVVGDMNSLKMYGLDGTDLSVYTAVQGQPYFSNIVAAVQDPDTGFIYFSDVHSKWIMRTGFGQNTTQFYRINHVIDGMTVYRTGSVSRLYWTDSGDGLIAYVELPSNGSTPGVPKIVVTGLSRPRAIKIHNGYIYWTEWGYKDGKVKRTNINSISTTNSAETLPVGQLSWVNGLYIDATTSRLYVADGHPSTKNVYNCSLEGSGCSPVPGLSNTLRHVYDIWVHNDILYYSDWKSKAVIAYSPAVHMSWPIIDNLMRPTQIYLKFPSPASNQDYCSANNGGCSDICVSLLGSRGCACREGRFLSIEDQKTCVTVGNETCPVNEKLYYYQELFKPALCVGCQCRVGDTGYSFFGDRVYNTSRCERIGQCPNLICGGDGSSTFVSSECCPRCNVDCEIKIVNCPQKRTLRLSEGNAVEGYLVDEYAPLAVDCKGLMRTYSSTRTPSHTIYNFTRNDQKVKWEVYTDDGASDSCEYMLEFIDDYPPTITCPNDRVITTSENSAEGRWTSPTVEDAGGVSDISPVCTPAWGSKLELGEHNISCTGWDLGGRSASCSFHLVVNKDPLPCPIQYLNHGNLTCNTNPQGDAECDIVCDSDYRNTQKFDMIKCVNGAWEPKIHESVFTCTTCKRRIPKAVSGNITVIQRNPSCTSDPNMAFTVYYMQDALIKKYLWRSYFPLVSTIQVEGCDKGPHRTAPRKRLPRDLTEAEKKNDISAKIVISGIYIYDRATLKQDIDQMLLLVADELNKNFLKLNYVGKSRHWTSNLPLELEIDLAVDGCLEGTVEADDGCDVCPAGMYTRDRVTCMPCPQGEYNEWEAQIQCNKCPDEATSPTGSYNRNQCKHINACSRECIIGLAVGFGGLIILVLILIIIALAVRLRRQTKKSKAGFQQYKNESYESPGLYDKPAKEQYDEINHDNMDDDNKYYNN